PGLRRGAALSRGTVAAGFAGILALGASGLVLHQDAETRLVAQETEIPAEAEPTADDEAPIGSAAPMEPVEPAAASPAAEAPETPAAAPDATATDAPEADALEPPPADPVSYETLQTGSDWPAYGGTLHATRYS